MHWLYKCRLLRDAVCNKVSNRPLIGKLLEQLDLCHLLRWRVAGVEEVRWGQRIRVPLKAQWTLRVYGGNFNWNGPEIM